MKHANRARMPWMRSLLNSQARLLWRTRRNRRAVLFLLCALVIMAAWACAELTIRSVFGFLNHTVEEQFVRASQIPTAQSTERMRNVPFKYPIGRVYRV